MTDNILGHKTSLSKLKTEIIPIIFSNYSGRKLEINNKRKTGKVLNTCKSNNKHSSEQPMNQKRGSGGGAGLKFPEINVNKNTSQNL